ASSATTSGGGTRGGSPGRGCEVCLPSADPHRFGRDHLDAEAMAIQLSARTVDALVSAAVEGLDPDPRLHDVAERAADPDGRQRLEGVDEWLVRSPRRHAFGVGAACNRDAQMRGELLVRDRAPRAVRWNEGPAVDDVEHGGSDALRD